MGEGTIDAIEKLKLLEVNDLEKKLGEIRRYL